MSSSGGSDLLAGGPGTQVAPEAPPASSLAAARGRKRKRKRLRGGAMWAGRAGPRGLALKLLLLAIIKQSCLHTLGQAPEFGENAPARGAIENQHAPGSSPAAPARNDFINLALQQEQQQQQRRQVAGRPGSGPGRPRLAEDDHDGDAGARPEPEDRRMKMINDAGAMLAPEFGEKSPAAKFARVIDIGPFVADAKTMVTAGEASESRPLPLPAPTRGRPSEAANSDNNAKSRRPARRAPAPDSDRLEIKDAFPASETSSETATISIINNRSGPAITSGQSATDGAGSGGRKQPEDALKCRVEEDLYLDFEEYKHYTCSSCYNLMPRSLFTNKFNLTKERKRKVWLWDGNPEQIVYANQTSLIRPSFKDEQAFIKWSECCRHAIDCCLQNAKYLTRNKTRSSASDLNANGGPNYELLDEWPRNKCHATWDGLSCWPDTPAGQLAAHDCPNHVYFFDFTPTCYGRVTKRCSQSGSWYIRNDHEWSDYSNCAILTLYATRMVIGSAWHVVSAIVIGPALLVLDRFPNRSGSKRVKILSNLLFWLLVNGLLAATQKIAIIGGVFNKARPEATAPPAASALASRLAEPAFNGPNATMQFHHYNQLNRSADGDYQAVPLMAIPAERAQFAANVGQVDGTFDKQQARPRRHLRAAAAGLEGGSRERNRRRKRSSQPWTGQRQQQQQHHHHQLQAIPNWLERFNSAERNLKHLNKLSGDYDNYSSNYKSDDVQGSPIPRQTLLSFPPANNNNTRAHGYASNADGNYWKATTTTAAYKYGTISNSGINVASLGHPSRRRGGRLRRDSGVTFHTNRLEATAAPVRSPTTAQPETTPAKPLHTHEPYIQISSALLGGGQEAGEIGERQTWADIEVPKSTTTTNTRSGSIANRCKRSSDGAGAARQQSAPVVLICWIFSLGIRITRQLGYAWMFTGAVYLCSVLHFAPAEPPALFIKWLMIITNGFPVVIGLVYIIARTIYDTSPLTLLVKLPYYYLKGDNEYIQYLWASQLDCWLSDTKYSFIEEIADFPNLVLIILNGGLFVVTLIIMCRINRPGSTRQEMSLGDYFKAAGTLVVLYGAHYMLIVYRVQVEGCIKDQVIYYSFLFVDGIQGMAVSYVFCYRTPEGKEIISKWWSSKRDSLATFACGLNWRKGNRGSRDQAGFLAKNRRFNQSTRSNNSSNCNGKGDLVSVELIEIKDTPAANKNF